jgi:hypothetical protein
VTAPRDPIVIKARERAYQVAVYASEQNDVAMYEVKHRQIRAHGTAVTTAKREQRRGKR